MKFLIFFLTTACINVLAQECYIFEKQSPESQEVHRVQTIDSEQQWCIDIDTNKKEYFIFKNELGDLTFKAFLILKLNNGYKLIHHVEEKGKQKKVTQSSRNFGSLVLPFDYFTMTDGLLAPVNKLKNVKINPELNKEKLSFHKSIFKTKAEDIKDIFIAGFQSSESAKVSDDKIPHNGYYWPQAGVPLAQGKNAPLKLYDDYVGKVSGTNPKSTEWEIRHHDTNVWYGGHCNGWAAKSVLHEFTEQTFYDDLNDQLILPEDIDGMRAETSYCVNWAFYGRCNNGNGDVKDIHADRFHKVLEYYIRDLDRPVAVDINSDSSVINKVISGYSYTSEEVSENKIKVVINVDIHSYSDFKVKIKENAYKRTKKFKYYLNLDGDRNIISGEWLSENPDFLWVPISEEKCGRENPRMDHKWIDHMVENLKTYEKKTVDLGSRHEEISVNHDSFSEVLKIEDPLYRSSKVKFTTLLERGNDLDDISFKIQAYDNDIDISESIDADFVKENNGEVTLYLENFKRVNRLIIKAQAIDEDLTLKGLKNISLDRYNR